MLCFILNNRILPPFILIYFIVHNKNFVVNFLCNMNYKNNADKFCHFIFNENDIC